MSIFNFYHDAALTRPVELGDDVFTEHLADGSSDPVDVHLYFGSSNAAVKAQLAINPGVDNIRIEIGDMDGENSHSVWGIKLATTQAGLASATGGATLDLQPTIYGGAASAVDIWVRVTEPAQDVVTWTDLAIYPNYTLKITAA